eukprot:gnl/MRDRNA2_/MRDRNA2_108336_c0_seq1.p1 gnl/MRDRNA2_/MRDRNA2_108336_c0~~gnl/MRDRNA2_/MRDRNA2_108336_c0_seq1.p1  ORF type:complete len:337 (+),score=92.81 gnl/MRDRNA2_/MRDRNA2_108336_c0_seq1:70-1080(+)
MVPRTVWLSNFCLLAVTWATESLEEPMQLAALTSATTERPTPEQEAATAQNVVNSDRHSIIAAMNSLKTTPSEFRSAAKNHSLSKVLSNHLSVKILHQVAKDVNQEKTQGVLDFKNALTALKQSSSKVAQEDALKAVKQSSEALDKLEKNEMKDAKKRMKENRKAEEGKVKHMYHAAKDAAKKMLHDKNSLERAQHKAGFSEDKYENEEGRNEEFAETKEDQAEDEEDRGFDSIEPIFDPALDHVLDDLSREHAHASKERHRAIHDAVEELRRANKSTKAAANKASRYAGDLLEDSSSLVCPSGLCLLTAASIGLLVVFVMRSHARPAPIVQPLLG